MKIDKIYINTHRYDFSYTRICIASIRYWYPSIPICLIVDYANGPIITSMFDKNWSITFFQKERKKYGWGFGKFEPLFQQHNERFLVLDADTVFWGPIIDLLEQSATDFIVDKEEQPIEAFKGLYYDPSMIAQQYPEFIFPNYSFNTGQWVGTAGIISKTDLDPFIQWGDVPSLKDPQCFKQADQGVFNFLLHLLEQQGRTSVTRRPFMIWPPDHENDAVSVEDAGIKNISEPRIIHWAGIKFKRNVDLPYKEVLFFYEQYYYSTLSYPDYVLDRSVALWLRLERAVRRYWKIFF